MNQSRKVQWALIIAIMMSYATIMGIKEARRRMIGTIVQNADRKKEQRYIKIETYIVLSYM